MIGFGVLAALESPGAFQARDLWQISGTPVVATFGTVLGIGSSLVHRELVRAPRASLSMILRKLLIGRMALVAAIVAPVVLATFFETLHEIQGTFLQFLIAYQNGFFFEKVLQQ
jgi:hypothetical protein